MVKIRNKITKKMKKGKNMKKTKLGKTMKRVKNKGKRRRKSYKQLSKKKLAITLKRAKKNIQKKIKFLRMYGGAEQIYTEVPQDPNQSPSSIEVSMATANVANDAGALNVLSPDVKTGGGKLPKRLMKKRRTMKKLMKLIRKK